jgi:hypothetical protein
MVLNEGSVFMITVLWLFVSIISPNATLLSSVEYSRNSLDRATLKQEPSGPRQVPNIGFN